MARDLILGLVAGLLALPVHAPAQAPAPRVPRVVLISTFDEAGARPYLDSLRRGMQGLGHTEGRTFRLEVLYSDREPARGDALIQQAVAGQPDVIVVSGLTNARRARQRTTRIPVVVATASDLLEAGLVTSLARPGGNLTGITDLGAEIAVKRLELLKELMPRLARVALLTNPDFPATPKIESEVHRAGQVLGVTVLPLHARDRASLWAALDSFARSRPDALLLGGDALFTVNARELIERTTAQRVPVAHYWPGTAEAGAVLSYQVDVHKNYERAAFYVDQILKGVHPGDLPVEQPTRYELLVNRRAAAALGIALSPATLTRADRIIE